MRNNNNKKVKKEKSCTCTRTIRDEDIIVDLEHQNLLVVVAVFHSLKNRTLQNFHEPVLLLWVVFKHILGIFDGDQPGLRLNR